MNSVKSKYLKVRHQAKQLTRQFFNDRDFIEIDSPILIKANAIEAYIDPIWVAEKQLRTSPEIYHKRLLSHGLEKIYELGHVFRDEPSGPLHLSEFTLLEWYRVGATLQDLVNDCEILFNKINSKIYNKKFEVRDLESLWLEFVGVDLRQGIQENSLVKLVLEAGYVLRENADFSDAFHHIMLSQIEPNIGQNTPCVVTRWPKQMAALSQVCKDDPNFSERFEIYFKGVELANAFLELTDPAEQLKRFEEERSLRKDLGKNSQMIDEDFIKDLDRMPSAAGIAVGFDRLLMLANEVNDISIITKFLENS